VREDERRCGLRQGWIGRREPGRPLEREWQAVEFWVAIGEYRGVVRVPRRVFQRLLPERPTPERCVEAYYLQRTRFESIAERKLHRRPVNRGWERGDQRARPALSCRWETVPPAGERLRSTQRWCIAAAAAQPLDAEYAALLRR
jgi:hypothetical protein